MEKPKFKLDRDGKRANIWLNEDVNIKIKVTDTPDGDMIEIYKCADQGPMALNIRAHSSNIIYVS